MFNFLKLHSSSSGDARRHVPFASIIHKHIFPVFFVTILFLTLFFRPYAAEALAQLTPEIQPVYETTIESLYDFVKVQLDDTHKQVFDLLLGSYMVGYAGMSNYELSYVYNSDTPVKEWLINSGADLYNTIISCGGIAPSGSSNSVGAPVIGYQQLSPMLQVAMGIAIKSKNYSTADDAYNDIKTSDNYPIPLNIDIMSSLNSVFGYYKGLYNWQFSEKKYTSNFTWITQTLSGTELSSYQALVESTFGTSGVPVNCNSSGLYNCLGPEIRFDFFINTSNNTVYPVNIQYPSVEKVVSYRPPNSYSTNFNEGVETTSWTFNPSQYNTYADVIQAAINTNLGFVGFTTYLPNSGRLSFYYNNAFMLNKVLVGTSLQDSHEYTAHDDKNLERPNQPTFLQGVENGLLDLKGLLEDILGSLELRPPVINNYYYPNGSNVPVEDIEPAMQNNTLPDSGVDVDPNLFTPLFVKDGNKSYISYLWYMTKPLILYTKDLFSCLVFDPVADFAASGPGYFVYGVIGLGLISGLLVKCLL